MHVRPTLIELRRIPGQDARTGLGLAYAAYRGGQPHGPPIAVLRPEMGQRLRWRVTTDAGEELLYDDLVTARQEIVWFCIAF